MPDTKKSGYIMRDRQEYGNGKPGYYWGQAWRIVDANELDMVQSWCRTKQEARDTAKACGITILGVLE